MPATSLRPNWPIVDKLKAKLEQLENAKKKMQEQDAGSAGNIEKWLRAYYPNDLLMPVRVGSKAPMYKHRNGMWSWKRYDLWRLGRAQHPDAGAGPSSRESVSGNSGMDLAVLLRDLCVIDVDDVKVAQELEERFECLRTVPRQATRQGIHYWFARSELADRCGYYDGRAQRQAAVDFKTVCATGTSGIILVAPSSNKRWIAPPWARHGSTLPPIPDALLDAVARPTINCVPKQLPSLPQIWLDGGGKGRSVAVRCGDGRDVIFDSRDDIAALASMGFFAPLIRPEEDGHEGGAVLKTTDTDLGMGMGMGVYAPVPSGDILTDLVSVARWRELPLSTVTSITVLPDANDDTDNNDDIQMLKKKRHQICQRYLERLALLVKYADMLDAPDYVIDALSVGGVRTDADLIRMHMPWWTARLRDAGMPGGRCSSGPGSGSGSDAPTQDADGLVSIDSALAAAVRYTPPMTNADTEGAWLFHRRLGRAGGNPIAQRVPAAEEKEEEEESPRGSCGLDPGLLVMVSDPVQRTRGMMKERCPGLEDVLRMHAGKLLLAGGAVLGAVALACHPGQDLDLFVCTTDESEANAIMKSVVQHLCDTEERIQEEEEFEGYHPKIIQTPNTITLTICCSGAALHGRRPTTTVQIVLRLYPDPASVIRSFDIAPSQVGVWFESPHDLEPKIRATHGWVESVRAMAFAVDPHRFWHAFAVHRILKYQAKGFDVAIPGTRRDAIQPPYRIVNDEIRRHLSNDPAADHGLQQLAVARRRLAKAGRGIAALFVAEAIVLILRQRRFHVRQANLMSTPSITMYELEVIGRKMCPPVIMHRGRQYGDTYGSPALWHQGQQRGAGGAPGAEFRCSEPDMRTRESYPWKRVPYINGLGECTWPSRLNNAFVGAECEWSELFDTSTCS